MQVNITARHGHLSEPSQAKITAKVERLGRLFERLMSIEVMVDLEHPDAPTVDLRVSAEHKHDFVAEVKADELMSALDAAVHKVEQQLRKYKQKVQDHHRASAPRQAKSALEPEEG